MVRVTLVLVTILALAATGVAVWAAVSLATPITDVPGETREQRERAATVTRFYAAVTESLQTARTATLTDVVSPTFVVHRPAFPDAVGLAAFDLVLDDLRIVCPECVVAVDSVVVDNDVASTVVTGRTAASSTVLGLPIAGDLIAWTAHDRLRIEDGRVAEYWNRDTARLAPDLLSENLWLTIPPTGLAQVGFTHLSLQRGARMAQAIATISHHIVVESGLLTVSTERASQMPPSDDEPVATPVQHLDAVGPGEHIMVPTKVGLDLRNDGATEVSAWVISLRPFIDGANEDHSWPLIETETDEQSAGVGLRVLATTVVAGSPGSDFTLAIARVTLGPGAGVGAHEVAGIELISVGAGELNITAVGGDARLVRRQDMDTGSHPDDDRRGERWQASTVLSALDTAILRGGNVATVTNETAAPVDLVILVISQSIRALPS